MSSVGLKKQQSEYVNECLLVEGARSSNELYWNVTARDREHWVKTLSDMMPFDLWLMKIVSGGSGMVLCYHTPWNETIDESKCQQANTAFWITLINLPRSYCPFFTILLKTLWILQGNLQDVQQITMKFTKDKD